MSAAVRANDVTGERGKTMTSHRETHLICPYLADDGDRCSRSEGHPGEHVSQSQMSNR